MKLYLHIGTEKTGSSFLQTLCAQNRGKLAEYGIFYPEAGKREKDMLQGRISPGNAAELSRNLIDGDFNKAAQWLSGHVKGMQEQGFDKLLLSNETLIVSLSDRNTFSVFKNLCLKVGFEDIPMLLVLRDPVDHAISLYKHRAKFGNAKPIDIWLREGYRLPDELTSLKVFSDELIDHVLTLQKYSKCGKTLKNNFFEKWLGVKGIDSIEKDRVNPSLTLSELILMKQLHQNAPGLVRTYYDQMIQIPVEQKSHDEYLISHYKSLISEYLFEYLSVYKHFNEFMPKGEQLNLPEKTESATNLHPLEITFSETQLKSWAVFAKKSHSISFVLKNGYHNDLRPILSRIKHRLFS